MSEQRVAVVRIEILKRRPKLFGLLGQGFFPGAMPRRDRRRGRKIGKPGNGETSVSLASTCRQLSGE